MQVLLALVVCGGAPQPETATLEAEIAAKFSPKALAIRSALESDLEGWQLTWEKGKPVPDTGFFVCSMKWVRPPSEPVQDAKGVRPDGEGVIVSLVMTPSPEAARLLLEGNLKQSSLSRAGVISGLGDEAHVLVGFADRERTLVAFRAGGVFATADCSTRALAEAIAWRVFRSLAVAEGAESE